LDLGIRLSNNVDKNGISNEGASELANCLKVNQGLTTLKLSTSQFLS